MYGSHSGLRKQGCFSAGKQLFVSKTHVINLKWICLVAFVPVLLG